MGGTPGSGTGSPVKGVCSNDDLILKTVALVKFLKTENLIETASSKFCVGRHVIPSQPRSHTNSHTFFFRISGLFFVFKNVTNVTVSILNPQIFSTY